MEIRSSSQENEPYRSDSERRAKMKAIQRTFTGDSDSAATYKLVAKTKNGDTETLFRSGSNLQLLFFLELELRMQIKDEPMKGEVPK